MFLYYIYRCAHHWKIKAVLCVGVCSITVEQDCAACICEGILKAVANSNADLDMAKKFKEEGCLRRRKGSGRPIRPEETVKRVRKKILQSPKKFLPRTSLETQIPPTTV